MKRCVSTMLALAALFLAPIAMNAQGIVTIGNNSASGDYPPYFPFNYYWYSTISESLYTQSDIMGGGWTGGAGKIESLAWNVTYPYNWSNGIITIMMTNSNLTSLSDGSIAPDNMFEVVWTGPAPVFTTTGWSELVLSTPFDYTGDGLYIKVVKAGDGWNSPYAEFARSYASPSKFRADYDDVPIATLIGWDYLYTYSFRPDIQLRICNGDPSTVDFGIPAFVNIPSTIPVSYTVSRPTGEFDASVFVNVYDVSYNLVLSEPVRIASIGGSNPQSASGIIDLVTSSLAAGYYIIEVTFNSMDQCNGMSDIVMSQSLLVLEPGDVPCVVYPGDVNSDGLCNYGDMKGLTQYIHDANLRASWLNGPARYRSDAAAEPFTYLEWTPQASVPWSTPEGCYMDTDGNGTVNNFDFIVIKLNWMHSQGGAGAKSMPYSEVPVAFEVEQNFPNPFNPETTIQYALPENAAVRIRVYNTSGELVQELVQDGNQTAGVHTVKFSGMDLASGVYLAVANIVGNETGTSFSKTIKMNLAK